MARSVLDRISSINKPVNRVESGVSPGNSSVSGDRFVANSISFDKLITLLYYTSNSLAIVCQTSTKRESRSLAIGREEASPSGINRREMNSRGGRGDDSGSGSFLPGYGGRMLLVNMAYGFNM